MTGVRRTTLNARPLVNAVACIVRPRPCQPHSSTHVRQHSICRMVWYGMVEVCEGAPVAMGVHVAR